MSEKIFGVKGYEGWDALIETEGFVVTAFSLSRLLTHMKSGEPWAILTAWRKQDRFTKEDVVPEVNNVNMGAMRNNIATLGLGYVDMRGAGQESGGVSYEPCYFVIGITEDQARSLGDRYQQDCVLWGQEGVKVSLLFYKDGEQVMEDKPIFNEANVQLYWTTWKDRAFAFLEKKQSSYMFTLPSNLIGRWGIYLQLKAAFNKKYGFARVSDALVRLQAGDDPVAVVQDLQKDSP